MTGSVNINEVKNLFLKLKEARSFIRTLFFLIFVFFICCFPIFLSFLLKNVNPSQYGLILGDRKDLEITYKEILFYFSLIFSCFICSVALIYIRKRAFRVIVVSVSVLYLFLSFVMILVDTVYYLIFAYPITFSAFQTVLNTNPEEVKDFAKLYISPGRILTFLLFITFLVFVISRRNWLRNLVASRIFFSTTLMLSIAGIIDFGQMAHAEGNGLHNMRYWDIIIGEYNEYQEFNRRLNAEKDHHNLSKEYNSYYLQDTFPKTIVLVISESLSKRHMSLYGYSRKTTPHLDTNRSIHVFRNCVTQAPLTIEAVPALFFNGHLSKKINLIALCNKLGYETTWISNQSGWGKLDRTIVLLSQLCKKSVFTDAMSDDGKSNSSLHFDEAVLSEFDKAITATPGKSKLIVLHLMGCHFDYEKRYPAGRDLFRTEPPAKTGATTQLAKKIINSYDNAVHYHDSIVNEIVKIFSKKEQDKNAALMFLSDHGEEVYDLRDHAGHGYPPTRISSEIPYFMVLSEQFRQNYPRLEQVMGTRANTPFSTANNFYTLLHLMNISSHQYKNRILRKSFFSALYDSTQPRLVQGADYDKMSF